MRRAMATFAGCCAMALSPAVAGSFDQASVGESAKRSATKMYEAFAKGDFETFVQYTYPKVVEMTGGASRMVEAMKAGMAELRSKGTVVKSAAVRKPSKIVEAAKELHALLPITIVMTVPGGELRSASHLLGISSDGGKTWTFIDTAPLTDQNVRDVLPAYNPSLALPPKQEPAFTPKQQ